MSGKKITIYITFLFGLCCTVDKRYERYLTYSLSKYCTLCLWKNRRHRYLMMVVVVLTSGGHKNATPLHGETIFANYRTLGHFYSVTFSALNKYRGWRLMFKPINRGRIRKKLKWQIEWIACRSCNFSFNFFSVLFELRGRRFTGEKKICRSSFQKRS